jgi:hypothetical protein
VSHDIVKWNVAERVMDNWAVGKLIDWAVGKDGDAKTKASLKEERCDLSAELAGPSPSPAETVLAETAATCWFAFRLHEARYAGGVTSEGGMTLAQSEHAQRRIDRAHRRFLSTVKALAAVRRLSIPSLQINVARQQVNQLNAGGTFMKQANTRSMMPILRAWLDGGSQAEPVRCESAQGN